MARSEGDEDRGRGNGRRRTREDAREGAGDGARATAAGHDDLVLVGLEERVDRYRRERWSVSGGKEGRGQEVGRWVG